MNNKYLAARKKASLEDDKHYQPDSVENVEKKEKKEKIEILEEINDPLEYQIDLKISKKVP